MHGYTDYCTTFYDKKERTVYFWDEIKGRKIGTLKVKDEDEAEHTMRAWEENAPENVICEILH